MEGKKILYDLKKLETIIRNEDLQSYEKYLLDKALAQHGNLILFECVEVITGKSPSEIENSLQENKNKIMGQIFSKDGYISDKPIERETVKILIETGPGETIEKEMVIPKLEGVTNLYGWNQLDFLLFELCFIFERYIKIRIKHPKHESTIKNVIGSELITVANAYKIRKCIDEIHQKFDTNIKIKEALMPLINNYVADLVREVDNNESCLPCGSVEHAFYLTMYRIDRKEYIRIDNSSEPICKLLECDLENPSGISDFEKFLIEVILAIRSGPLFAREIVYQANERFQSIRLVNPEQPQNKPHQVQTAPNCVALGYRIGRTKRWDTVKDWVILKESVELIDSHYGSEWIDTKEGYFAADVIRGKRLPTHGAVHEQGLREKFAPEREQSKVRKLASKFEAGSQTPPEQKKPESPIKINKSKSLGVGQLPKAEIDPFELLYSKLSVDQQKYLYVVQALTESTIDLILVENILKYSTNISENSKNKYEDVRSSLIQLNVISISESGKIFVNKLFRDKLKKVLLEDARINKLNGKSGWINLIEIFRASNSSEIPIKKLIILYFSDLYRRKLSLYCQECQEISVYLEYFWDNNIADLDISDDKKYLGLWLIEYYVTNNEMEKAVKLFNKMKPLYFSALNELENTNQSICSYFNVNLHDINPANTDIYLNPFIFILPEVGKLLLWLGEYGLANTILNRACSIFHLIDGKDRAVKLKLCWAICFYSDSLRKQSKFTEAKLYSRSAMELLKQYGESSSNFLSAIVIDNYCLIQTSLGINNEILGLYGKLLDQEKKSKSILYYQAHYANAMLGAPGKDISEAIEYLKAIDIADASPSVNLQSFLNALARLYLFRGDYYLANEIYQRVNSDEFTRIESQQRIRAADILLSGMICSILNAFHHKTQLNESELLKQMSKLQKLTDYFNDNNELHAMRANINKFQLDTKELTDHILHTLFMVYGSFYRTVCNEKHVFNKYVAKIVLMGKSLQIYTPRGRTNSGSLITLLSPRGMEPRHRSESEVIHFELQRYNNSEYLKQLMQYAEFPQQLILKPKKSAIIDGNIDIVTYIVEGIRHRAQHIFVVHGDVGSGKTYLSSRLFKYFLSPENRHNKEGFDPVYLDQHYKLPDNLNLDIILTEFIKNPSGKNRPLLILNNLSVEKDYLLKLISVINQIGGVLICLLNSDANRVIDNIDINIVTLEIAPLTEPDLESYICECLGNADNNSENQCDFDDSRQIMVLMKERGILDIALKFPGYILLIIKCYLSQSWAKFSYELSLTCLFKYQFEIFISSGKNKEVYLKLCKSAYDYLLENGEHFSIRHEAVKKFKMFFACEEFFYKLPHLFDYLVAEYIAQSINEEILNSDNETFNFNSLKSINLQQYNWILNFISEIFIMDRYNFNTTMKELLQCVPDKKTHDSNHEDNYFLNNVVLILSKTRFSILGPEVFEDRLISGITIDSLYMRNTSLDRSIFKDVVFSKVSLRDVSLEAIVHDRTYFELMKRADGYSNLLCSTISPGGDMVALGNVHGVVSFYELRTLRLIKTIKISNYAITSIAFNSETALFIADSSGQLLGYNFDSGLWAKFFEILDVQSEITAVKVIRSSNSLLIAVCSGNGFLYIIGKDGEIRLALLLHQGSVNSLDSDVEKNICFIGCNNGKIKIINYISGRCLATIWGGTSAAIKSVELSPDNKYLAVGYLDGNVQIWDIDKVIYTNNFVYQPIFAKQLMHPISRVQFLRNKLLVATYVGVLYQFDILNNYQSSSFSLDINMLTDLDYHLFEESNENDNFCAVVAVGESGTIYRFYDSLLERFCEPGTDYSLCSKTFCFNNAGYAYFGFSHGMIGILDIETRQFKFMPTVTKRSIIQISKIQNNGLSPYFVFLNSDGEFFIYYIKGNNSKNLRTKALESTCTFDVVFKNSNKNKLFLVAGTSTSKIYISLVDIEKAIPEKEFYEIYDSDNNHLITNIQFVRIGDSSIYIFAVQNNKLICIRARDKANERLKIYKTFAISMDVPILFFSTLIKDSKIFILISLPTGLNWYYMTVSDSIEMHPNLHHCENFTYKVCESPYVTQILNDKTAICASGHELWYLLNTGDFSANSILQTQGSIISFFHDESNSRFITISIDGIISYWNIFQEKYIETWKSSFTCEMQDVTSMQSQQVASISTQRGAEIEQGESILWLPFEMPSEISFEPAVLLLEMQRRCISNTIVFMRKSVLFPTLNQAQSYNAYKHLKSRRNTYHVAIPLVVQARNFAKEKLINELSCGNPGVIDADNCKSLIDYKWNADEPTILYNIPSRNTRQPSRIAALQNISRSLADSQSDPKNVHNEIHVEIIGDSGLGKTLLAVDYVYESIIKRRYNFIAWIDIEKGFVSAVYGMAEVLSINNPYESNLYSLITPIQSKLANKNVLFVIDNIDSEMQSIGFLNIFSVKSRIQHVITTSNNKMQKSNQKMKRHIFSLDNCAPSSGYKLEVDLYISNYPVTDRERYRPQLSDVFEKFKCNYLLIDLFLRYCYYSEIGISTTLSSFIKKSKEDHYLQDIAKDILAKTTPNAQKLLYMCVCLFPDDIPCNLLNDIKSGFLDFEAKAGIDELAKFGFITFHLDNDSIRVHRAVKREVFKLLSKETFSYDVLMTLDQKIRACFSQLTLEYKKTEVFKHKIEIIRSILMCGYYEEAQNLLVESIYLLKKHITWSHVVELLQLFLDNFPSLTFKTRIIIFSELMSCFIYQGNYKKANDVYQSMLKYDPKIINVLLHTNGIEDRPFIIRCLCIIASAHKETDNKRAFRMLRHAQGVGFSSEGSADLNPDNYAENAERDELQNRQFVGLIDFVESECNLTKGHLRFDKSLDAIIKAKKHFKKATNDVNSDDLSKEISREYYFRSMIYLCQMTFFCDEGTLRKFQIEVPLVKVHKTLAKIGNEKNLSSRVQLRYFYLAALHKLHINKVDEAMQYCNQALAIAELKSAEKDIAIITIFQEKKNESIEKVFQEENYKLCLDP